VVGDNLPQPQNCAVRSLGGVRERPNRHAWKACEAQVSVGSNPTPSAMNTEHEAAMQVALNQAELAASSGEVPVGAVVVYKNEVIAARHNEREQLKDPTAHAEILVLRDAAKLLNDWRLVECALVVTLEPCVMCAGAIQNSRIRTLVFGVADLKGGATASLYNICADPRLNHETKVIGPTNPQGYSDMLSKFFAGNRQAFESEKTK
jgi:tRNA(adenine34) deaminase